VGETNNEQVAQLEKQIAQLQQEVAKLENELKAEGKTPVVADPQTHISWVVVDEKTSEPLASKVSFTSQKGNAIEVVNKTAGIFEATLHHTSDAGPRYNLNIESPGYLTYNSSLFFQGTGPGIQTIADTVRLKKPVANFGYILNVYFDLDSTEPLSYDGIQNLLVMMQNSATMKVEIGGHTDSYGDDAYNNYLSKQRAEVVKKYLVKAGIEEQRITAIGYGKSKPIASNASRETRKLNRRTEFVVVQQ